MTESTTAPADLAPAPKIIDELRPFLRRATKAIDSSRAVDLVFRTLAVASESDGWEDDQTRGDEIGDLLTSATPEDRTRAAQIATGLVSYLIRLRSLLMTVKQDKGDPDIVLGEAEITPDGWLVVKMGNEVVGRVPYNPERGEAEAGQMAEEILAEHVRLHVSMALEAVRMPTVPETIPDRDGSIRRRVSVSAALTAPAGSP